MAEISEFQWLLDNPQFEERPATLREFLGPKYLDIDAGVREAIKDMLAEIIGEEVQTENPTLYPLAMCTGGIGIGKTTIASIVLCYLVHWCLCLKDPQGFFDLLPGSRIAFMQMSTSSQQAKEVVFGDIKARVEHGPWFRRFPYDPNFKNQFRFPKDIWIVPGDSAETTFEGYNILGGILDEADSHKQTKVKDYAAVGYDTIYNRMTSRFEDRGFLFVIGQMKSGAGFAASKWKEFGRLDNAYRKRLTIWESRGEQYYRDRTDDGDYPTFIYDTYRKQIVPTDLVNAGALDRTDAMIEVPTYYLDNFKVNPEKALKDLAGIPPAVGDPFISLAHKIDDAVERWEHMFGDEPPLDLDNKPADWFMCRDSLRRVGHLDLAYSPNGDGLGFTMAHVSEMVEREGEMKPFIVVDTFMHMHAAPGTEIDFGNVRHFLYNLRGHHGFKLEFVSFDGFESHDFMTQLRKRRIGVDLVSMDRQMLPYFDLREAIYEDRIAIPRYLIRNPQLGHEGETIEIATKELKELVDEGKKVEHPVDGSKDVADSLAGVTFTLMGDRRYHKKVTSIQQYKRRAAMSDPSPDYPAFLGDPGVTAPVPPTNAIGRR